MKVENDNLFHKGSPMPEAYALYFSGQAYLNPLTKSLNIANVTFEPGCRNNWHIHHKGGQILLVTAGRGWYQAWGETARELHPGDVVEIPPETKHWHGAAVTTGCRILRLRFRLSVVRSNGWKQSMRTNLLT